MIFNFLCGLVMMIVTILIIAISCGLINDSLHFKDDNLAKELTEQAILYKTGLALDLTPDTPENSFLFHI